MTTIAWDGTTLAADRLACYGNTRRTVRKIVRCGEYVYGGSGDLSECHVLAEWLSEGAPAASRPTLNEESCCGIAIRTSDGRACTVEGRRPVLTPIREPH